MKINFKLPGTKLCLVLWFRDNKMEKTMIPTPANNECLRSAMLRQGVGYGQIRAVQPVAPTALADAMTRLR